MQPTTREQRERLAGLAGWPLMPHIRLKCPRCGSDDIRADAEAAWSIELQAWELVTTFDARQCANCDAYVTPIEVPAPNEPEPDQDDCTCADRSWYGPEHDTACPLDGPRS